MQHLREKHKKLIPLLKCSFCQTFIEGVQEYEKHLLKFHSAFPQFELVDEHFRGRYQRFSMSFIRPGPKLKLSQVFDYVFQFLLEKLKIAKSLNIQIILNAIFSRIFYKTESIEYSLIPFASKMAHYTSIGGVEQIQKTFDINVISPLNSRLDDFIDHGSNWRFERIATMDFILTPGRQIRFGYCPGTIANTIYSSLKGTFCKYVYIPPADALSRCFMSVIGAHILIKPNDTIWPPHNLTLETAAKYCNFENISFPISLEGLQTFIDNNPKWSFNISSLHFCEVSHFKIVPFEVYGNPYFAEYNVHILLFELPDGGKSEMFHCLLIVNPKKFYPAIHNNALLGKKGTFHIFTCNLCNETFKGISTYWEHIKKRCRLRKSAIPKEPYREKGFELLEFSTVHARVPKRFTIYLDFESFEESVTLKHIPVAACLILLEFEKVVKTKFILDHHFCGQRVVQTLLEWETFIKQKVDTRFPLNDSRVSNIGPITLDEVKGKRCILCFKPLFIGDPDKFSSKQIVRDHLHHLPLQNFFGLSHVTCNLKRRNREGENDYICSILFHYGLRYDIYLFIQYLNIPGVRNLKIIPARAESIQRFRAIKFNCYCLIDSFAFLPSSLDEMSKTLQSSIHSYCLLRQVFPECSPKQLECLKVKGIFPYSLLSAENYHEITEFPTRSEFYNVLTQQECSAENYKKAALIWNTLKVKNFAEYLFYYVASDTILLAEIYQKFCKIIYEKFYLCPSHFISLPSMTLQCALLNHNIESFAPIQIFTRPGFVLQKIRQSLRGGFSFTHCKYANAKKMNVGIFYGDCNSLYSVSMTTKLPYRNYRLYSKDVALFQQNILPSISLNSDINFIICVDLHVPVVHHEKLKQFPPIIIHSSDRKKLISTLEDVKEYVIYAPLLKFFCKLGIQINKIHWILSFDTAYIFKNYLEKCLHLRRETSDPNYSTIFKLAGNSLYGKMLEQTDFDRMSLIKSEASFAKVMEKIDPNTVKRCAPLSQDFILIRSSSKEQTYGRGIIQGFVTLEISKYIMLEFIYDGVFSHFPESAIQLLWGDTDSLCWTVQNRYLTEDGKIPQNFIDAFFDEKQPGKIKFEVDFPFRIL